MIKRRTESGIGGEHGAQKVRPILRLTLIIHDDNNEKTTGIHYWDSLLGFAIGIRHWDSPLGFKIARRGHANLLASIVTSFAGAGKVLARVASRGHPHAAAAPSNRNKSDRTD
jgi:hypothetical protein